MAMSSIEIRLEAVERYHQGIRHAEINDLWAHMRGTNSSLLKFEEVATRLHIRQQIPIGHQMVLLRHIVGSVGRYREFTKDFLPRAAVMQDRWVAVDVALNSMRGVPPVDLYKIGDAYFVIDGNHRISVARANGNSDIEARVIECQTERHYTLEDFASDQWAFKAAYDDFMAETELDCLSLQDSFLVSELEYYQTLLQHIAVHRYLSNQRHADGGMLSWKEAVLSWHERVYKPVVEAIRRRQLLKHFPKRSETDLYVLITQYRERVAEAYELAPLGAASAVALFAENHGERSRDRLFFTLRQTFAQLPLWGVVQSERPNGMTKEEFCALRLRHEAGELSLSEAGRKATQEERFEERRREGSFQVQFSG